MKIIDMKKKVKIVFEYPKKSIPWATITEKDLKQLSLRVFLRDGTEVYSNQIEQITFKLNEEICS